MPASEAAVGMAVGYIRDGGGGCDGNVGCARG
jgi:hypothetical protein